MQISKDITKHMRSSALSQLNIFKALRHVPHVSCLTSLLLLTFLAGCGSAPVAKKRYFWPPLPIEPKIEYLDAYSSDADFPKTGMQKLQDSFVGTEEKGLGRPVGIFSDGEGKVYLTDPDAVQVVIFDLEKKEVRSFGNDEYAGVFQAPMGVTLDGSGNVYISDPKKNSVFVFTRDEKPLMTIGDTETLKWPVGMVVDDGLKRLYVANVHLHNIAVFDLSGKYLFSIGKRGPGDGEFNFPIDVDLDSKGNLVVADTQNARVQIVDPNGKFIRKFGQRGDGIIDFQAMKNVAVDRATDNIYVTDGRLNKMLIFNKEGEALFRLGGEAAVGSESQRSPGGFSIPQGIAIDRHRKIYVADSLNRRFQIFKIIDEDWLKEHPIKEGEAAKAPLRDEKDKKEKGKGKGLAR